MRQVILPFVVLSLGAQVPLEVYGTLSLSLTRDTGLLPPGVRTPGQEKGSLWDLDERGTQLGLRLKAMDIEGFTVSGRVEADFNGGSATAPTLRLRHAYLRLGDSGGRWEVLAGRTNEVIAPFRADSINFPAENWPGDVGTRRTQLRATWFQALGADQRWVFCAAFNPVRQGLEGTEETVQVPVVEARAALEFRVLGQAAEFGLWGHHGSQHHPAQADRQGGDLRTRSLGVDLRLPLGPCWTLTTEPWQGEMADAYPSSAMASLALRDAVRSRGGWASLTYAPVASWRFNAGLGIHDPENLGLHLGQRDHLSSWFLNGFKTWAGRLELGLEVSRWRSTFKGTTASNDDLRVQVGLGYSF